jgi:hypothetical protein
MNVARFVVSSRRVHSRRRGAHSAAIIVAAALGLAQTPVLAGAKISGSPEAVTLVAQDSSIEEILVALGRDFNVQYRSSADLNRHITGTYHGSLRQVVTRILDRYSFVVASSGGGIKVTVFGKQNARANNGGPPLAAASGPAPSSPAVRPPGAADPEPTPAFPGAGSGD